MAVEQKSFWLPCSSKSPHVRPSSWCSEKNLLTFQHNLFKASTACQKVCQTDKSQTDRKPDRQSVRQTTSQPGRHLVGQPVIKTVRQSDRQLNSRAAKEPVQGVSNVRTALLWSLKINNNKKKVIYIRSTLIYQT